MSVMSALGLSSAAQTDAPPASASGLSIEAMFGQIMGAVQKSQSEISELRQECADLRQTNASLERQIRDGLQTAGARNQGGSGWATPAFAPSAPGSPHLRPKTPFLSPANIPTLSVHAPGHGPSPLGENAITGFPFHAAPAGLGSGATREIPGFFVIIPAGGAGTRLWPLSREGHPKFLLDLTLKGRSLIQSTWDRLIPLSSPARTTVVAGPAHIQPIREQLPDMAERNMFCEPGPKDSMAAIGLAAAILGRRDPGAVIGSFAADHMISGDDAFLSAVTEAVEVARKDFLVTIGIAPSHPSTGFGYIKLGDRLGLDDAPNARLVSVFKEKPDARTASSYIKTGNYRWNAGMFVSKATFLMDLLKEYEPEMWEGLTKIAEAWDTPRRQAVLDEVWPGLKKIPIDNAVAEPAAAEGRVAVVPATFGWDDVGDFSSLAEMIPAEASQPRILGDPALVLTESSAGGIVVPSSGRLVACLGVDDLVIVDMPDTLMVTTRARSQEVKRLVKRAKESGWKSLL